MRTPAVLLVLALLAAVSCGGDDGLSREEFVKEANAACERGSEELAAEERRAFGNLGPGDQPSREVLEEFVRTAVRIVEEQTEEIARLDPPDEIEEDVERMIRELRTTIEALKELGAGALRGNPDPFARANEMAAELGLDRCAAS